MAQVLEASFPSRSLVRWSSGCEGGASLEEVSEKAEEMEEEVLGAAKAYSGQGAEEMKLEPSQKHKPAPEENLTWSCSCSDEKVLPSTAPHGHSSSSPLCPRRKPRPRPSPGPASEASQGPGPHPCLQPILPLHRHPGPGPGADPGPGPGPRLSEAVLLTYAALGVEVA